MSEEAPPLRLFVDESYGQEDYYVAGVLLTPAQYESIAAELHDLRLHAARRFGLPTDIELHAHRLMQTRGPWTPLHDSSTKQFSSTAGYCAPSRTAAHESGWKVWTSRDSTSAFGTPTHHTRSLSGGFFNALTTSAAPRTAPAS